MTPQPAIYLGAYASMPNELRSEPSTNIAYLREAAARTGCAGLEVPWGSATFSPDPGALSTLLGEGGSHVLTLVAATMEARARHDVGLASLDPRGRAAAVELVRDAYQASVALGSSPDGRPVIRAVEVQSAASVHLDRIDDHTRAFAESLAEIAGWNWHGTELLVEHCDAATGVRPVKGFLPIEAELTAIEQNSGCPTPLALGINWGRSVLEARDVRSATRHARLAADAGRLGALAFSGVAAVDTVRGPAWGDSHIAARGPLAASAGLGESLLGEPEVDAFLRAGRVRSAASSEPLVIVKVAAAPGLPSPIDIVAETFALVAGRITKSLLTV